MHTPEPQHGMAQYVSEIGLALAEAGVQLVLFCPQNFEQKDRFRAAGVPIANAAFRDVSNAGLAKRIMRNVRFAAKSVLAEFRLVRPGDVVHFQSLLHLPLGFLFFLAAMLRHGSIVLTVHDPVPHRWRLPRPLNGLERKMLELSYRMADEIIVHNQQGKDLLVRKFHMKTSDISVVPHGRYFCESRQELLFPSFDCFHLLAFGAIRENKGVHLAIQAIQMLDSAAGTPVRLTIAGRPYNAAEQEYWRRCKQLISAKPENIEVIESYIADDEIGSLLARHHAVILPYTDFHSESGVASLALSHSRPILATSAGGLGELMQQGACGIPIAPANAAGVEHAISAAIRLGPEGLRAMGMKGNEFVRRMRSWDSIASQTTAVYNQVIGKRSRQRFAVAHL